MPWIIEAAAQVLETFYALYRSFCGSFLGAIPVNLLLARHSFRESRGVRSLTLNGRAWTVMLFKGKGQIVWTGVCDGGAADFAFAHGTSRKESDGLGCDARGFNVLCRNHWVVRCRCGLMRLEVHHEAR